MVQLYSENKAYDVLARKSILDTTVRGPREAILETHLHVVNAHGYPHSYPTANLVLAWAF